MDKLMIKNLDLYYSEFKALKNINLNIQEKEITAFHRSFRLWKIHAAEIVEPDERSGGGLPHRGRGPSGRREYL